MIRYIDGDMFQGTDDVLVHGCNCFKAMASGVAKQIRKYYHPAAVADYNFGDMGDKGKLGTYSSWTGKHAFHNRTVTIVNAYTQYMYGTDTMKCDYAAIERVMKRINLDFPTQTIGMPQIGCGLAGGDWNVVQQIINDTFGDREITVYIFSAF